jgi:hypothetical protein
MLKFINENGTIRLKMELNERFDVLVEERSNFNVFKSQEDRILGFFVKMAEQSCFSRLPGPDDCDIFGPIKVFLDFWL